SGFPAESKGEVCPPPLCFRTFRPDRGKSRVCVDGACRSSRCTGRAGGRSTDGGVSRHSPEQVRSSPVSQSRVLREGEASVTMTSPRTQDGLQSTLSQLRAYASALSRGDSEDLVQEAMARALANDVPVEAIPWLRTVMKRIAIDKSRRAREVAS